MYTYSVYIHVATEYASIRATCSSKAAFMAPKQLAATTVSQVVYTEMP